MGLFFITIVRENLTNRRGFLLIRAQFVLHSAYSLLIPNWFLKFLAACSKVILLIVMNSCAIPAKLSRFAGISVRTSYLNQDWLIEHHDRRIFFNKTSQIPPNKKKLIRGDLGDSWPVWNRGINQIRRQISMSVLLVSSWCHTIETVSANQISDVHGGSTLITWHWHYITCADVTENMPIQYQLWLQLNKRLQMKLMLFQ